MIRDGYDVKDHRGKMFLRVKGNVCFSHGNPLIEVKQF